MTNLFDYLEWRGDLTLMQSPFGDVDSLILSTMAYIVLDDIVSEGFTETVTVKEAAERYTALPEEEKRVRVRQDSELMEAMAATARFGGMKLCGCVHKLDIRTEKQFAAVTVLMEDGTAFVAFRGTDLTLVGWKEDFNMSFLDAVPSQIEAVKYLWEVSCTFAGGLRVGGHSKGGNLAVYAAAMSPRQVQERIVKVYNHDGPGFRDDFLKKKGYLAILPKTETFVPQTSVIGMLLEHGGDYTVIRSRQIGVFQHNSYYWEVLGNDFIRLDSLTDQGHIFDAGMKHWLEGISSEEREDFIDAVFDILSEAAVDEEGKLELSPLKVLRAVRTLSGEDEETKEIITDCLKKLFQAMGKAAGEYWKTGGRKTEGRKKGKEIRDEKRFS